MTFELSLRPPPTANNSSTNVPEGHNAPVAVKVGGSWLLKSMVSVMVNGSDGAASAAGAAMTSSAPEESASQFLDHEYPPSLLWPNRAGGKYVPCALPVSPRSQLIARPDFWIQLRWTGPCTYSSFSLIVNFCGLQNPFGYVKTRRCNRYQRSAEPAA